MTTKNEIYNLLCAETNEILKSPSDHYKYIRNESKKYKYEYSVATNENNIQRNRYTDVLANDKYRFKLNKYSNNYVNADVVSWKPYNTVYKNYILSQGPIKKYIFDFLLMLIESDTETIICLTKQIENNVIKFDTYFSDDFELIYFSENEQYFCKVMVINKYHDENKIIRHISIKLFSGMEQLESKMIQHIQFIGWPDHGVPIQLTDDFLKLYDYISQTSKPIVVHCSAGIGRSGTFVVISEIIECIKRGVSFNIKEKIIQLRNFREGIVQNQEQMKFCYGAICYYLSH